MIQHKCECPAFLKRVWYRTYRHFSSVLGVIIGFSLAVVLLKYSLLKVDTAVTVGNLIQATATIIVGLVVAAYINRNSTAERKEKDILFEQLKLVSRTIDEFEHFKDGGPLNQVASALKKMALGWSAFGSMRSRLNYGDEIESLSNFKAKHKKLRDLATGTPIGPPAHGPQGNEVVDSVIKWASEKRIEIEECVLALRMAIFQAQVAINRAIPSG